MAQPIVAAADDSGGGGGCTTTYNTVFVDTSLDTHLALLAADSDTVSDLKKKILHEHILCFPDVGEIQIDALKVKRKGFFYHLSDSMFVKSAFDGVNKGWFLSVEAMRKEERVENQHPRKHNPGKLLDITNNPAVEGVDLLLDGCPKRLSNIDEPSGLQVESDQHVKEKPIASQFGSGHANGEVLEDLEMEVANTDKISEPKLPENYNLFSKEFEDLGTSAAQKDDSFRNGIMDVQRNISLEGAPHTQSVANKKRKAKKKNKDAVDDHASVHGSSKDALRPEPIQENSSGNAAGDISHEMGIGNKIIAEEPCRTSSPDFNKSDTGVQMSKVAKGIAATGEHVECGTDVLNNNVVNVQTDKTVKESSHSMTAVKRKRKAEEIDGSENSSTRNRALIYDAVQSHRESLHSGPPAKKKQKTKKKGSDEKASNENQGLVNDSAKQTSGPEIANSHCSVGEGKDGSAAPALEDNHMLTTSSICLKRKRKKRSSNAFDQAVDAVLFSEKDVRGESSVVTTGTNAKDSARESDTVRISGERVQGALTSGPKEKFRAPVQGVKGLDNKNDTDAGNMEDGIDRPGSAAVNVDGHLAILDQETENIQDDVSSSRHENTILNGSDKSEADQPCRVEEERELSQNNDPKSMEAVATSNLLDANGILEPKSHSKKRRKSKKAKDSVGAPVSSGIDHNIGSIVNNSSTKSHEAIDIDHLNEKAKGEESTMQPAEGTETKALHASLPTTDIENDDVIQNVLESLPQVNENLVDTETVGDKLRKKKKKKQGSTEKDPPELPRDNEDTSGKFKNSVGAPSSSGMDHAKGSMVGNSSTKSHEAINIDHLSEKAMGEENIMQPTEGMETKTLNMSIPTTDRETDVIQNVVETLLQFNENSIDAKAVGDKERKRKKKKQGSTEKVHPELQKDNEDISGKSKKPEDSVGAPISSGTNHTKVSIVGKSSTESHDTTKINQLSAKAKEEENVMQPIEGIETKTLHASPPTTDKETDDVIRNVLQSLQQVNENPVDAVTVGDISRKKKRKKRGSTEKDHQELQKDDEDASGKDLNISTGTMREDDGSFPHDTVNGSPNKNSHASKATDQEVYIDNDQVQPETAESGELLAHKVTQVKQPENELKSKKNRKKVHVHHNGPSPDLQSLVMPSGNEGHEREAQAGDSGNNKQQRSLSKDEDANLLFRSNKKLPKVSESQLKPPKPGKSNSATQEVQRPSVISTGTKSHLKKSKEAASNSSLDSSKSMVNQKRIGHNNADGRQSLAKSTGKVVNGSVCKKSLLAVSGTIFNEHSDGSSEYEGCADNSDTSTQTPSDASMSSDYSDGESNANFNSPENGPYSSKGKDGGNDITRSYSSGPKGLSLDTILRNSSSYKKAKLIASQLDDSESQPVQPLDTESQPAEAVPDSQPNS